MLKQLHQGLTNTPHEYDLTTNNPSIIPALFYAQHTHTHTPLYLFKYVDFLEALPHYG